MGKAGANLRCAVYLAFVTGVAQAEKLCEIAEAAKKRGIPVVIDPILGDNGKKYNSVGEEQARAMAMLVSMRIF